MANQYTGSFEHIIKNKYGCNAKQLLERCALQGMTYQEAEKVFGVKYETIRKWANRFNIKLKSSEVENIKSDNFMKMFKQKNINKYNILSRCWCKKLYY